MAMINPRTDQSVFTLTRPRSVAIYDTQEDAQRAVDYLADHGFPVANLIIVGTDLKSVERVTGTLSWGKVLASGGFMGITWGLFITIFFWLFSPGSSFPTLLAYGLGMGVLAGALSAAISYATTRGRRDFSSLTQTVATHYEILCEAEHSNRARQLLGSGPQQTDPRDLAPGLDRTGQQALPVSGPAQPGAPVVGQPQPGLPAVPVVGQPQPGVPVVPVAGAGQPSLPDPDADLPGAGRPAFEPPQAPARRPENPD